MDKRNSNIRKCLEDVERKLKAIPLQVNLPVGIGASFVGVLDLPSFTIKTWELKKNPYGSVYLTRYSFTIVVVTRK